MKKKWFYVGRFMAVTAAYWDTQVVFTDDEDLVNKLIKNPHFLREHDDETSLFISELEENGKQCKRIDLITKVLQGKPEPVHKKSEA